MLVGAQLVDRFRVVQVLGRGGMGVVYEAYDAHRGEHVALKTLEHLDADAIYRLKREFRSVADVVHPNLVRVHELFNEGALWFFTMERIRGVPFLAAVRDVGAPRWDCTTTLDDVSAMRRVHEEPIDAAIREAELRSCLAQLAAGVHAIHRTGKLHRDLKPSNVLVDVAGRLAILDFGLAIAGDAVTSERAAGTPAYMAPEQLVAGGASVASDWYAVGVMLFEALTGRWPFTHNVDSLLAAKTAGCAPPDPRVFSPAAPVDLSLLAQALLASRAEDRAGADDVVAVVGSGHATVTGDRARPTLVGRDRELAQLRAEFEAVRRGEPRVVAVTGVSGIGKTSLVASFLDEVRTSLSPEAVVLSGRCREREAVPFKAIDDAIDALSRYLLKSADTWIPRDVPELCGMFPVLARVPAFAAAAAERAPDPDPRASRKRAFASLRELLARIAATAPLVVTVDDLQWGDEDSRRFLGKLVAPPEPPPLLLVGLFRSRRQASAQPVQAGYLSTITLQPLALDSAIALATQLVHDATRARTIAEDAGGNPYFIVELARADRPVSLAGLLAERIAALSLEARALLDAVAAAGTLSRGAVPADAEAVIPALCAQSLLRSTGERLEIYHERVRDAVVARRSTA